MSATQQATNPLVLEERSGSVLTLRLNRPEKLNALESGDVPRAGPRTAARQRGQIRARRRADRRGTRLLRGRRHRFHARCAEPPRRSTSLSHAGDRQGNLPGHRVHAEGGDRGGERPGGRRGNEPRAGVRSAGRVGTGDLHAGVRADWGSIPISAPRFFCRGWWACRAPPNCSTRRRGFRRRKRAGSESCTACFRRKIRRGNSEAGGTPGGGPPLAFRDVKRTMIGEAHKELEDALDEENRLQLHCFLSEDCAEGLAAFFEKRAPNFRGH